MAAEVVQALHALVPVVLPQAGELLGPSWIARQLEADFAGGRIPTIAINRVLLKNFSVVGVHWGYYQRRGSPLVQEWMDGLMKLYGDGRIRPVIYRAYPLREAAAALGALASRESYGKVVLVP